MEDKEKKVSEIFSLQCKVIPLPSDNQESQPSNSNNEHSEGSNGTEEDGQQMEDVLALIGNLPIIISYLVYGGIFICIFEFITLKENKRDGYTHYFVSCIVSSFVFKMIYETFVTLITNTFHIQIDTSNAMYYFITIVITVIISYLASLLFATEKINFFLLKIGISRTTNPCFWKDIYHDGSYCIIRLKEGNDIYFGALKYIEELTHNPKIALTCYAVANNDNKQITVDYHKDAKSVIVLDTEDIRTIEIVYTDGKTSEPWERFKEKIK